MTADRQTIPESLILARLLMMQSKRLLLAGLERRLQTAGREHLHYRADRLRVETEDAQESYCSSLLRWGSPEKPEYWSAAYGRLIATADKLSSKLRRTAPELPPHDRYAVAAEVEMLETLAEDWRTSLRGAMRAAP
jgi:hypothetical protein